MSTLTQTRALIPDLGTGTDQIFTDDEINDLLVLWADNPMRAAGSAMLAIANDTAKLIKLSTDDLNVDTAASATAMRENAKLMFKLADDAALAAADEAFIVVYPEDPDPCVPEATAHPDPWYL